MFIIIIIIIIISIISIIIIIIIIIIVIIRHCTQYFCGNYSRVTWIFSWRISLSRFVSF